MKQPYDILLDLFNFALKYERKRGAPVTQLAKRWPYYLAAPGSSSLGSGNLSDRKQESIAHSLSLSPTHCPDMI